MFSYFIQICILLETVAKRLLTLLFSVTNLTNEGGGAFVCGLSFLPIILLRALL